MVIEDKQASFAAPDCRQLCHFRSECPLATVNCILNLSGCDGSKKSRRKISIKIHGRLVDTDYNDSIATLCSVVVRSATCQRPDPCYMAMSTWLGKTDKQHDGEHENVKGPCSLRWGCERKKRRGLTKTKYII